MKSNVISGKRRTLGNPNPKCLWPKLIHKLQQVSFSQIKKVWETKTEHLSPDDAWTLCQLSVLLEGLRIIPCVQDGSRSCNVCPAFLLELPSQKHGAISGKPQQREGETHTVGERGGEWNKLPLTTTDIYRTTCFWLQSISLFISDLSRTAQHTGAYCKRGAAGPTEVGCDQCWANSHKHTINSSLSETMPGSVL